MGKTMGKPTYEELMAMYEEAASRAESLSERVKSLEARNAALEDDRRQLADALAKVSAELGDKESVIRRYSCERFYSKRDSVYKDAAKAADRPSPSGAKRGRKPGTRNFGGIDLEALSRGSEPIVLDAAASLPEGERAMLVRVGEDESYRIELTRAKVAVRKVIRPLYKKADGKMAQAPSDAPISGSPAGASLLADLQFSKYGLGIPDYRYRGWLALSGFPASTQLLTKWTLGAAEAEAAVAMAITASLAASGAKEAHIDETPVEMVKEASPKTGKLGKRGYMFVLSADGPRHKVRAYSFSMARESSAAEAMLGGWKGTIVCDGYAGYDRFAGYPGMKVQRCLAHARRKWADLAKSGRPGAEERCALFDRLFEEERKLKASGASPEERLKARNSPEYRAIVEAISSSMRNALSSFPEKSPEWSAASYFLSMEGEFLTFMSDGHAEIDNNAAERCCKKLVMARRNFLFVQGRRGGDAAAVALTLMETAIANGVEPRGYLEWVLSNQRESAADPERFLPWSESVPESLRLKK